MSICSYSPSLTRDDILVLDADLAKATGLGKGGISNYVVGRYEPKADVISKLAKALNCSEMWLWGYDVPMERPNTRPCEKALTENALDDVLLELLTELSNLTEEERAKVSAFIQGLKANR